jgi:hypothetical protein
MTTNNAVDTTLSGQTGTGGGGSVCYGSAGAQAGGNGSSGIVIIYEYS